MSIRETFQVNSASGEMIELSFFNNFLEKAFVINNGRRFEIPRSNISGDIRDGGYETSMLKTSCYAISRLADGNVFLSFAPSQREANMGIFGKESIKKKIADNKYYSSSSSDDAFFNPIKNTRRAAPHIDSSRVCRIGLAGSAIGIGVGSGVGFFSGGLVGTAIGAAIGGASGWVLLTKFVTKNG